MVEKKRSRGRPRKLAAVVAEDADGAEMFLDVAKDEAADAGGVLDVEQVDSDVNFLNNLEVLVKLDIKTAKGDIRVRQTGVKLLLDIRREKALRMAESKQRRDNPFNKDVLAALGLGMLAREGLGPGDVGSD